VGVALDRRRRLHRAALRQEPRGRSRARLQPRRAAGRGLHAAPVGAPRRGRRAPRTRGHHLDRRGRTRVRHRAVRARRAHRVAHRRPARARRGDGDDRRPLRALPHGRRVGDGRTRHRAARAVRVRHGGEPRFDPPRRSLVAGRGVRDARHARALRRALSPRARRNRLRARLPRRARPQVVRARPVRGRYDGRVLRPADAVAPRHVRRLAPQHRARKGRLRRACARARQRLRGLERPVGADRGGAARRSRSRRGSRPRPS